MSNYSKFFRISLFAESILIIYFSLIPYTPSVPGGPEFIVNIYGYIEHFLAYFAYGILWERVLNYTRFKKSRIILALLIGSVFGGLNELAQSFVPNRHMDLIDWLMDIIGSGSGGYFVARKVKASSF